jgi:hypothetical protein
MLGICLVLPIVLLWNYSHYVNGKAPIVIRELQSDGTVWEYMVDRSHYGSDAEAKAAAEASERVPAPDTKSVMRLAGGSFKQAPAVINQRLNRMAAMADPKGTVVAPSAASAAAAKANPSPAPRVQQQQQQVAQQFDDDSQDDEEVIVQHRPQARQPQPQQVVRRRVVQQQPPAVQYVYEDEQGNVIDADDVEGGSSGNVFEDEEGNLIEEVEVVERPAPRRRIVQRVVRYVDAPADETAAAAATPAKAVKSPAPAAAAAAVAAAASPASASATKGGSASKQKQRAAVASPTGEAAKKDM